MNKFSIRDIENLTGIKAHTIRIWEQRYNMLRPKRTETNIRYYDADDLKELLRVALLNDHGYKISAINKMSRAEINNTIQKITDADFRLQAQVNRLLEATLAMDMTAFEETLDEYTTQYGVEKMVESLILHYLEKIGLMWMTDKIFPAQEHLVSHIITRKLSAAIEHLPRVADTAPAVLLFLPEEEVHEIGLLYMQFLFRKYGKYPIYLGPNTPLGEAVFIYEKKKPSYIYIHLTSAADEFDVDAYIADLNKSFRKSKVYISGSILHSRGTRSTGQVHVLHTLKEARDLACSI